MFNKIKNKHQFNRFYFNRYNLSGTLSFVFKDFLPSLIFLTMHIGFWLAFPKNSFRFLNPTFQTNAIKIWLQLGNIRLCLILPQSCDLAENLFWRTDFDNVANILSYITKPIATDFVVSFNKYFFWILNIFSILNPIEFAFPSTDP